MIECKVYFVVIDNKIMWQRVVRNSNILSAGAFARLTTGISPSLRYRLHLALPFGAGFLLERKKDMKVKNEKECNGYTYTSQDDNARTKWKVATDYINNNIYLCPPDEDDDVSLDDYEAFGKAVVTAAKDMKREAGDRFET